MNSEVRNADRVLVLGSPLYRLKVHAAEDKTLVTGVGWEAMLLTAQIFQGNRGKTVLAIARGKREEAFPDFLLTTPAHDVSTPDAPNGYLALLKDLRGEHPKAPPVGAPMATVPDEVLPLFEAPAEVSLAVELRQWIDARWPEGKPDAIYPSWSEFEIGKVGFDHDVVQQLEAYLNTSPCTLIVGRSASGKSVLGAGLAFRWSRLTGRRAFWLDVGDYPDVTRAELCKEVKAILSLSGSNLLVLDNAQSAKHFVDWAVTQLQGHESRTPGHTRLLILTRPSLGAHLAHAELQERLRSYCVELIPNGALFANTAIRLLSREGITVTWSNEDYDVWSHEFGGDLIAFGQAVLRGRGRRPQRSMASEHVRRTYIDPMLEHSAGLTALERLCATSMLDLAIDELALGGPGYRIIPGLIESGHAQAIERGTFRRWKLAHPGLASLILETLARDSFSTLSARRDKAFLDIVSCNPSFVGCLTLQIANPAYGDAETLMSWLSALKAKERVLEAFLCKTLHWAVAVERRIPNVLPWHVLRDVQARTRCLEVCRHTPLGEVTNFLRYAERREPTAAGSLLAELLQDTKFDAALAHTPPDFATNFLKYAEDRGRENDVKRVVSGLLAKTKFRETLSGAGPHDAVAFLKYAEQYDKEATQHLLLELVKNIAFRSVLRRAALIHVVTFIKYAQTRQPNATRDLLVYLLNDVEFEAAVACTSPDIVLTFLLHSEQYEPVATKQLLRKTLANTEFRQLIDRAPLHVVAPFLVYADHRDPEAAAPMVSIFWPTFKVVPGISSLNK